MYIQGVVGTEDWTIKQNKPICTHEVYPYRVLKRTFQLVSLPKKAKKKLSLWPRVIKVPKEGHTIHCSQLGQDSSKSILRKGTVRHARISWGVAVVGCRG